MTRGEVWWASLPRPIGSEPGGRRPVLVVQANAFNESSIRTVIVLVLTSNIRLADAPGNVLLPRDACGLSRDSVANVSKGVTLDKGMLNERVGPIPDALVQQVEEGLRLCLEL